MGELVALSPASYLGCDAVVDHEHPVVRDLAGLLRASHPDDVDLARAAFEVVRDDIAHSWDAQDPRVTVSASQTLQLGVGLCFAKSHLLTALLRASDIPTGLCYQRLSDDEGGFSLHGLVAVHLEGAWHRQDPRGNKPGVDAQFSLGRERLAWPVRPELGERDYPTVFTSPAAVVVEALRGSTDVLVLCRSGLPAELPGS